MTDHDEAYTTHPDAEAAVAQPTSWRTDELTSGHNLPPLFALVGAAGGVGTTTLAKMWAPAADSGQLWPANRRSTQWCVLVARLSMAGVDDAASRLRNDLVPEPVDVFGIIWTPPRPGRIPKEVHRYAATIGELVDHTWTLPWIDELVLARRDALAAWLPGTPLPDKKKSTDLAVGPPLSVCTVGADIVSTVTTRYRG